MNEVEDWIKLIQGDEMKEFKQWWSEAEIFAGEGSMDAAEQAWDAAVELQWISVKDRLPFTEEMMKGKDYIDIIIIAYDGNEVGTCFCAAGNMPEFWVQFRGDFEIDTITHWMPLPEPPE